MAVESFESFPLWGMYLDPRVSVLAGGAHPHRQDAHLFRDPCAPRRARLVVARCCAAAGLSTTVRQSALLLTSELVTNAIVHGRGRPHLKVDATEGGVYVSVRDEGTWAPVLRPVSPDAEGGRGLLILQELADAWGVIADRPHTTIWFELSSAT